MESPEKPTNDSTSKMKENVDEVDDRGLAEVENKEALLQDKVIWKQLYDNFIFQTNIVQTNDRVTGSSD